MININVNEACV